MVDGPTPKGLHRLCAVVSQTPQLFAKLSDLGLVVLDRHLLTLRGTRKRCLLAAQRATVRAEMKLGPTTATAHSLAPL
jgi:uncharacterized protein (DUF2237 family)